MGENIVVIPEPPKAATESGILMMRPSDAVNVIYAEVYAVGPGIHNGQPMALAPGDRVMYPKYGFDQIVVDGKGMHLTKLSNILAKVA